MLGGRALTLLASAVLASCGAPAKSAQTTTATAAGGPGPKRTILEVLPAESDAFPATAKAVTDWLSRAHVAGIDRTQVSKVSLEVVQLSIECVEPSAACYQAVAHTLSADRILFAQITPGPKHKQVKVTISLFALNDPLPHSVEAVYASEQEAEQKAGELVSEVTQ